MQKDTEPHGLARWTARELPRLSMPLFGIVWVPGGGGICALLPGCLAFSHRANQMTLKGRSRFHMSTFMPGARNSNPDVFPTSGT